MTASQRLPQAYMAPGGISYFSNEHGWACDNVESYDVGGSERIP